MTASGALAGWVCAAPFISYTHGCDKTSRNALGMGRFVPPGRCLKRRAAPASDMCAGSVPRPAFPQPVTRCIVAVPQPFCAPRQQWAHHLPISANTFSLFETGAHLLAAKARTRSARQHNGPRRNDDRKIRRLSDGNPLGQPTTTSDNPGDDEGRRHRPIRPPIGPHNPHPSGPPAGSQRGADRGPRGGRWHLGCVNSRRFLEADRAAEVSAPARYGWCRRRRGQRGACPTFQRRRPRLRQQIRLLCRVCGRRCQTGRTRAGTSERCGGGCRGRHRPDRDSGY